MFVVCGQHTRRCDIYDYPSSYVTTRGGLESNSEPSRPSTVSWDNGSAREPSDELGTSVTGRIFLDPRSEDVTAGPDVEHDPESSYAVKESIELAFVAALQHLPANQRAVLILRDVLSFAAAKVADPLGTSRPSVNSALQRARRSIADRISQKSQLAERVSMVERRTLDEFVAAWERADVPALVELLAKDVRFTMPPLPAWFDGREDVAGFLTQRLFTTPWPLVPMVDNSQPGFACYQVVDEVFGLGAVIVLTFRGGQINWIASFLDPDMLSRFGLPAEL